jgi:hypothetical protein
MKMKTEIFKLKFYDTEFEMIITHDFPFILEEKNNLAYKLNLKEGIKVEEEYIIHTFQGNSNKKEYTQYYDSKGTYIKYRTGTSIKPGTIKIYK